MTDDEILAEFRAADALLEGHFILSSGLRSPRYLQCARVLMDRARAERLARALAAKLPAELRESIDAVVSPAMGGVIIGHEMGRALGRPAMFVERPDGAFELRRGFRLEPGEQGADGRGRRHHRPVVARSDRGDRGSRRQGRSPRRAWSTARAARSTSACRSSR